MKSTIIIPACNEEKYIKETLKNLQKNHEIIVVCNGCTDNTEKIVKEFPVKLISTTKRGTSIAKNLGAKESSNEMLIFLDADIIINEKIINKIENTKFDLGTIKLIAKEKKFFWYSFLKNLEAKYHSGGGVIFCKKEIFNKIKGFNENLKFGEDLNLIKKAKTFGKYGYIPEPGIVSLRRLEKSGYLASFKTRIKRLFNKNIDYPIIR